jgi:SAM-dependent methyltransferase
MTVDPKAFWEDKILTWEKGRNDTKGATGSILERITDAASNSLRYRIQVGVELLAPYVKGKSVLEVGCGSGLIAQKFIDAGAIRYRGFDIAENRIALANRRKADEKWSDTITFHVDTISAMAPVTEDVVLSLGVLDWLTQSWPRCLNCRARLPSFMPLPSNAARCRNIFTAPKCKCPTVTRPAPIDRAISPRKRSQASPPSIKPGRFMRSVIRG